MKRLFTSCFGLGFLPIAPGTWGSLPPVIIFIVLSYLSVPVIALLIIMSFFVLAGSFACVKYAPFIIDQTGKTDPGEIVADEFAGQALTFLALALLPQANICLVGISGFVFFRIFDIAKPWPIRKIEKLPQGWGILADDLLAGVYAAISLLVFIRLLKHYSVL